MSVILAIAGLVFGGYLYQPAWFDDTPYHYQSTHETLAACEEAQRGHVLHGQHGVCVGESPAHLYTKVGEEVGLPYPPFEPYIMESIPSKLLDDVGVDSIYS